MTNEPKKSNTSSCKEVAHKAMECRNYNLDFNVRKFVALEPIKFLKSEIEDFRDAFSGYRYELQDDGDYYIASNFVSYKDLQVKILAERVAKINAAKPLFALKDYEHKAKHQKPTAQKKNECAKRRSKNKQPKQRKK